MSSLCEELQKKAKLHFVEIVINLHEATFIGVCSILQQLKWCVLFKLFEALKL